MEKEKKHLPISFSGSTEDIYETKISNGMWIFYDIPGNAGWILYTVAFILILVKQPEYLENPMAGNLFVAGRLLFRGYKRT